MTSTKRICFGVPSVFSFGSKTCSVCADFGHCRRLAHDKLKVIDSSELIRKALIEHERYGLGQMPLTVAQGKGREEPKATPQQRVSRAKHQAFDLTDNQKQMLEHVPVRVKSLMSKLFKRGHDVEIRMALRDGHDPLLHTEGYRSLKLTLAKMKRGIERGELRVCFMETLGWSYLAAMNEVSLLWRTLPAKGLAIEKNGRLVVAPSVKGQTEV